MKLLAISCNNCGAPLEVPEKTKFVTCRFCESQLQVHHTNSTAYTEVLEALERKTTQIADDVASLKIQNSLLQADRDWENLKQKYMVKGKDGYLSVPTKVGTLFGAVFGVCFGLIWTVVAGAMTGGVFAIFGLIFIGVVIAGSINSYNKAEQFEAAQKQYRSKRLDLISQEQQQ